MSKIFGMRLIYRTRDDIDDKLRKEQAVFRSGRGITEQTFILRNIIEQVNEWQATIYISTLLTSKKHSTQYTEIRKHLEELKNTSKNQYNIEATLRQSHLCCDRYS